MEKYSIQRIRASSDKKGFTLVEVIVVLVILAILAALLVPKLTGWITEAKDKATTGEAHLVLSAAQAYASEQYAMGKPAAWDNDAKREIPRYLQGDAPGTIEYINFSNGKVTEFIYDGKNGSKIKYGYNKDKKIYEFTKVP